MDAPTKAKASRHISTMMSARGVQAGKINAKNWVNKIMHHAASKKPVKRVTDNPAIQNAYFFGDSIAVGYKNAYGSNNGNTQVGIGSGEVLKRINSFIKSNPGGLAGQTVVLSSGYSNSTPGNTKTLNYINDQVSALKNAGATVVLLGVVNNYNKNGGNGTKMNQELKQIADTHNVFFTGGLGNGSDNLHPNYKTGLKLPEYMQVLDGASISSTLTDTAPPHKPLSIASKNSGYTAPIAIMGSYTTNQTGHGTSDHYDIRLPSNPDGTRNDPNPYVNRFMANGKTLDAYKQTSKYKETRGSKLHWGVDYGLNGSFGGNTKARELYLAPEWQNRVSNIRTFSDTRGGGNVTEVTFDDGITMRILHQDDTGRSIINNNINAWKGVSAAIDPQYQQTQQIQQEPALPQAQAQSVDTTTYTPSASYGELPKVEDMLGLNFIERSRNNTNDSGVNYGIFDLNLFNSVSEFPEARAAVSQSAHTIKANKAVIPLDNGVEQLLSVPMVNLYGIQTNSETEPT